GKAEGKHGQLVNWLRFIGSTNREERAMLATTSPVLQILNEKIDVLTLSPVERKLYESRMKLKSDITTISETQFNAGMQQGKSLGLAEGEIRGSRQANIETARNLLAMGLSIENIAAATSLTVQEVEKLDS
ncbi:MAG: PD-(D/E)XK nuclease family transposase, partial [Treponema sp.]